MSGMADVPGYPMASDVAHLSDDGCPKCGAPITWVREPDGAVHNADCRRCMVVWNARPQSVVFEITGREAQLTGADR